MKTFCAIASAIAPAPVPVLRAHKRPVDSAGRLVSASSLAPVLRL